MDCSNSIVPTPIRRAPTGIAPSPSIPRRSTRIYIWPTNSIAREKRRLRHRTTTRIWKGSRGRRSRIVRRQIGSSPSSCAWRIARRVLRSPIWRCKSYRLAEKLAIQTRQPKLESVADVNEAALQAKAGSLSDALATLPARDFARRIRRRQQRCGSRLVRLRALSRRRRFSVAAGLCLPCKVRVSDAGASQRCAARRSFRSPQANGTAPWRRSDHDSSRSRSGSAGGAGASAIGHRRSRVTHPMSQLTLWFSC